RRRRVGGLLPGRSWGIDANGLPVMRLATATNISENGALREGVRCPLRRGEVVDVQYNRMKAEFVVVWAGRAGTHHEGEIGLQSLPAQPCIWDAYLNRAYEFVGEG